jgi:hypothetical protein
MSRGSNRNREVSGASSRAARDLAVSAGLLFVLALSGCASVSGVAVAPPIDIMILTTDRETTDQVLRRLQSVERMPASQTATEGVSRGTLAGANDGSVYSILVGRVAREDDATMRRIMKRAVERWRPRYMLVLGTTLAVANEAPLGAVGIVTMSCEFDLDRFEESRDMGNCYRPAGGLRAAALSLTEQWEASSREDPLRADCSPARVMKLAALSGESDPGPRYVEVVAGISENIHRGLIFERDGIFAAEAVEDLRHEGRAPIGFLMIRGVSDVRRPGMGREEARETGKTQLQRVQKACAARDTADFATELIRYRWPVSSRSKR